MEELARQSATLSKCLLDLSGISSEMKVYPRSDSNITNIPLVSSHLHTKHASLLCSLPISSLGEETLRLLLRLPGSESEAYVGLGGHGSLYLLSPFHKDSGSRCTNIARRVFGCVPARTACVMKTGVSWGVICASATGISTLALFHPDHLQYAPIYQDIAGRGRAGGDAVSIARAHGIRSMTSWGPGVIIACEDGSFHCVTESNFSLHVERLHSLECIVDRHGGLAAQCTDSDGFPDDSGFCVALSKVGHDIGSTVIRIRLLTIERMLEVHLHRSDQFGTRRSTAIEITAICRPPAQVQSAFWTAVDDSAGLVPFCFLQTPTGGIGVFNDGYVVDLEAPIVGMVGSVIWSRMHPDGEVKLVSIVKLLASPERLVSFPEFDARLPHTHGLVIPSDVRHRLFVFERSKSSVLHIWDIAPYSPSLTAQYLANLQTQERVTRVSIVEDSVGMGRESAGPILTHFDLRNPCGSGTRPAAVRMRDGDVYCYGESPSNWRFVSVPTPHGELSARVDRSYEHVWVGSCNSKYFAILVGSAASECKSLVVQLSASEEGTAVRLGEVWRGTLSQMKQGDPSLSKKVKAVVRDNGIAWVGDDGDCGLLSITQNSSNEPMWKVQRVNAGVTAGQLPLCFHTRETQIVCAWKDKITVSDFDQYVSRTIRPEIGKHVSECITSITMSASAVRIAFTTPSGCHVWDSQLHREVEKHRCRALQLPKLQALGFLRPQTRGPSKPSVWANSRFAVFVNAGNDGGPSTVYVLDCETGAMVHEEGITLAWGRNHDSHVELDATNAITSQFTTHKVLEQTGEDSSKPFFQRTVLLTTSWLPQCKPFSCSKLVWGKREDDVTWRLPWNLETAMTPVHVEAIRAIQGCTSTLPPVTRLQLPDVFDKLPIEYVMQRADLSNSPSAIERAAFRDTFLNLCSSMTHIPVQHRFRDWSLLFTLAHELHIPNRASWVESWLRIPVPQLPLLPRDAVFRNEPQLTGDVEFADCAIGFKPSLPLALTQTEGFPGDFAIALTSSSTLSTLDALTIDESWFPDTGGSSDLPPTIAITQIMWEIYGWSNWKRGVCLHLSYFFSLIVYCWTERSQLDKYHLSRLNAFGWLVLLSINEVREFLLLRGQYLSHAWNWLDLVGFVFAHGALAQGGFKNWWTSVLASVSLICGALRTLRIFLPIRQTGPIVYMVQQSVQDVLPFMFVLLTLLAGYSTSLYIVTAPSLVSLSADHAQMATWLGSPFRALMSVYDAMLGTFDLGLTSAVDSELHSTFVLLLLLIISFSGSIVLLNLLIAVISDSFENMKSRAVQLTWKYRAETAVEGHALGFRCKSMPKWLFYESDTPDLVRHTLLPFGGIRRSKSHVKGHPNRVVGLDEPHDVTETFELSSMLTPPRLDGDGDAGLGEWFSKTLMQSCKSNDRFGITATVNLYVAAARVPYDNATKSWRFPDDDSEKIVRCLELCCKHGFVGAVELILQVLAAGKRGAEWQVRYLATSVCALCIANHHSVLAQVLSCLQPGVLREVAVSNVSPLAMCCEEGHPECLDQLLVSLGESVGGCLTRKYLRARHGSTVPATHGLLTLACIPTNVACLSILLEQGRCAGCVREMLEVASSSPSTWVNHSNALGQAVKSGNLEAVQLLLRHANVVGIIPNQLMSRSEEGLTPLWHSASLGYETILSALLEAMKAAEPELTKQFLLTPRNSGTTPLFMATHNGHHKCVMLLLEALDDERCVAEVVVAPRYEEGHGAIHVAAYSDRACSCDLMLSRLSTPDVLYRVLKTRTHESPPRKLELDKCLHSATALMCACACDGKLAAKALLNQARIAGLDLIELMTADRNVLGQNCLQAVCAKGHAQLLHVMLEHIPASQRWQCITGYVRETASPALHLAVAHASIQTFQAICSALTPEEVTLSFAHVDELGETTLSNAVRAGNTELLIHFIQQYTKSDRSVLLKLAQAKAPTHVATLIQSVLDEDHLAPHMMITPR